MAPDALTFASIAASVVGSAVAIAVVGVRTYMYWRRAAAPVTTPCQPDADHFARLKMAIEAIAAEVERIGEGQRFLTRLHADPLDRPAPAVLARDVT